ncbi:MAG TPA: class I SAM-dependent methyltransferase [bacterium]|nr:class I SAM-dependent methyltransferase [bacterium]
MIAAIVGQFGHPRGTVGRVTGWVMAYRPSNRQRNRWVVSLLDVQPTDRVLEIGFGPGIAIQELSWFATAGHVYGVDHSQVMVRQACRRNAHAIRAGRVDLRRGSADDLPTFGEPLDAVLAVNSMGFWPDPARTLRQLRARLRPGGQIAIASQPRCPGATSETSQRAAHQIRLLLEAAGYSRIRIETLDLDPPAVCVLGVNDAHAERREGEGFGRSTPSQVSRWMC